MIGYMNEKYDFETVISRKNQGSYKWEQMYKEYPDLPDDIIPFSVADMELQIAPEIKEGLKKYIDETVLGYTGANDNYLEIVVNWMKKRHNFDVKKEWIVTSSGVVSALYDAIKAYTEENQGVIVFTPVYYPFYSAITSNNRKIIDCPLIENNRNYTIDFQKFEEFAKDKNNRLLILCSPHNPVGRVWTKEELERIGEIALKNDLIIISDEIHFDILMKGQKHTVLQTISNEISEITVTCTAPTKTFNLAGIGISNIIIKNEELRKKFIKEQEKSSSHVFAALGFKACELAYTKAEKWFEQFLELINKNQQIVSEFFENKFTVLKAPLIQGTYLQWLDFRELGLKNKELKRFMNEKAKIFFSEGYTFGKNGDGFERMNLAVPTHILEKGLERLYNAIKQDYPEFCK
jgi:hemolysin